MNFQQGGINGYGIMCVFRNGTNSRIFFFFRSMNLERNLDTLVKVDHLLRPMQSCSVGQEPLVYEFSAGLD